MRRSSPPVLVVAGLVAVLAAVPAIAANQTVTSTIANVFTPRVVAVKPGETLTIFNTGGVHNVDWEDSHPSQPSNAVTAGWTVQRTFARVGAYRYYCIAHGSRGGRGHAGVVYVTPGGSVPPPGFASASAVGGQGRLTLRVNVTERTRLTADLRRGSSPFGTVSRTVLGGPSTVSLSSAGGKRLSAGRYSVVLRLGSGARRSALRTLSASVR